MHKFYSQEKFGDVRSAENCHNWTESLFLFASERERFG